MKAWKKGAILGALYGLGPFFMGFFYTSGYGTLFFMSVLLFSVSTLTIIPINYVLEILVGIYNPVLIQTQTFAVTVFMVNALLWIIVSIFIGVLYRKFIDKKRSVEE